MRNLMRTALISTLAALAVAAALTGCRETDDGRGEWEQRPIWDQPDDLVERGRYIVSGSGCHDCHTPLIMGPNGPERDLTRALSGHPDSLIMPPAPRLPEGPWQVTISGTGTAYNGPWGTTFTANLTPDKETGLGAWTVDDFIATFRTGRHQGKGRKVLPPMPIDVYANYSDADLAAIFAYLQTLKPVRNQVPTPIGPAIAQAEVH
jgi:hypothetical protein